ncbi:MAG: type II toxin-antitoxin system RelE/ParE family toxin [Amphritea sp.]
MWEVITTDKFDEWFDALNGSDRANVIAGMLLLQDKGPHLSRPYADTVNDSKFANMKELRVQSKGDPLRAFFAFDPERKGILLCAGNKVGDDKRFYKRMIPIADKEYETHLNKRG